MKKYFKVLLLRNVMQFQSEIAYRVEVVFLLLNTVVLIAATAILYTLIFSQTKLVGDWTFIPMLYLYAVGNVAVSIYTMFAWGPIYHQFRPAIKTGFMDTFLLKPMSPWFMLMTGRFDMSGLARFIPSFALLVFLLVRFPIQANLWLWFTFFLFFGFGMLLLYLLIFLIYAAGFWTTSTDYFHHLAWSFISATSQPTSAYPRFVFGLFTTIVPVAFAAVVPVRMVTGLEPVALSRYLFMGVVLAGFWLTSAVVWKKGLRRYGSVSS